MAYDWTTILIRAGLIAGGILFVVAIVNFIIGYFRDKNQERKKREFYGNPVPQYPNQQNIGFDNYNIQRLPNQQDYPKPYPNPNYPQNYPYPSYQNPLASVPKTMANPIERNYENNNQLSMLMEQLKQINIQLAQNDLQDKHTEERIKELDMRMQENRFEKATQTPFTPSQTRQTAIEEDEKEPALSIKEEGIMLGKAHFHLKIPDYAGKDVQTSIKNKFDEILQVELKAIKKRMKKEGLDIEKVEYEVE